MRMYASLCKLIFGLLLISLWSCKAYKQDILFNLDENFTAEDLKTPVNHAEENYRLQANDLLSLEVATNNGERLVDPNFELLPDVNRQANTGRDIVTYLIQTDGTVKLPIVGIKNLSGLTLIEAEEVLEQAYNIYYVESFVKLKVLNRRVVVLGANGGQVIPLDHDNTSLVEILALYGGLNLGAKSADIKLIRGDLTNPEVYLIDLSSLQGMRQSIVQVESGDIIYVQPWRRPWLESLRDVAPILGVTSSLLTLIVVIQNLAN